MSSHPLPSTSFPHTFLTPFALHRCQQHTLLKKLRRKAEETVGEMPGWLADQIAGGGATIVSIGGETCAFRMASQACGKTTLTGGDVWEGIDDLCGSTDDTLRER